MKRPAPEGEQSFRPDENENVDTAEHWQEIYEQVIGSETEPRELTTALLFEMASHFAVSGDYDKKAEIYEWIGVHPDANTDDVVRVKTYREDLKRRFAADEKGDVNVNQLREALEALRSLPEPEGVEARSEWLQAIGQCHLMLKEFKEAIQVQSQILKFLDNPETTLDKKLYFLETIMAMKIENKELDDELERFFDQHDSLIADSQMSEAHTKRAQGAVTELRGRAAIMKQDWPAVVDYFLKCFEIFPSVRNKAKCVVPFLYALDKAGIDNNRRAELENYFVKNRKEIMPTDLVGMFKEQHEYLLSKPGLA